MKKYTHKASGIAAVIIGTGALAAVASPFAGLGLGAYAVSSAAATAGMGNAASLLLGAAGALGGAWLGSIAMPFVFGASVLAGVAAGGIVTLASRAQDLVRHPPVQQTRAAISSSFEAVRAHRPFPNIHAKPSFAAANAGLRVQAAKLTPVLRHLPKFG